MLTWERHSALSRTKLRTRRAHPAGMDALRTQSRRSPLAEPAYHDDPPDADTQQHDAGRFGDSPREAANLHLIRVVAEIGSNAEFRVRKILTRNASATRIQR